jgi:formylglycine-generating enzyme required for sulfatase activity
LKSAEGTDSGYVKEANWRRPGFEQTGDHPAVCLSWNDAVAYADWLTKETGRPYRLPSEAEWEYAVRAGTTTSRFWGDDPNGACTYANVADRSAEARFPGGAVHDCDDGHVFTAPVGSFKPNPFGLLDIQGNAWEWVQDCWNDGYEGAPADGSAWTDGDCGRRVLRGGGWHDGPAWVRSAYRYWDELDARYYDVGVRLAQDL